MQVIETLDVYALYEFFVCADLSSELPKLPDEIKLIISSRTLSCLHGCSETLWYRFGKIKQRCCICRNKEAIDELCKYHNRSLVVKKTNERFQEHCIICKAWLKKRS
ncbi:Hypothetical protein BRZCDTV_362 [Brazilian cedratvirus IHUMI]|uniref:Uncharacterized protein n=1 Tax=Brazilian cedratvirus IHUMI TaxID=2126980 RepID=A0A2R8FEQ4_9VIRU|nr:Hypothetical protein BRZCDTV_362 [Brazilian cedratvirus IHUMI]